LDAAWGFLPRRGSRRCSCNGYLNIEKYLSGIDSTQFVDYTKVEIKKNILRRIRVERFASTQADEVT